MHFPCYFLSHGGGPWTWLDGPMRRHFDELEAHLSTLLSELPTLPKAIVVVTAHWETDDFAVSSAAAPGMLYDYSGFPPHTYEIVYPAPGSPELAQTIAERINDHGLNGREDPTRGYDHGTFSLLQVLRPQADIPVVQVSIRKDYDPTAHFELGRCLAPLREEGILLLGSGLSYHNLSAFNESGAEASAQFDAYLASTLLHETSATWEEHLSRWEQAPGARLAHPREDHLVPLFAAVGASLGDSASRPYDEETFFGGLTVSNFAFG